MSKAEFRKVRVAGWPRTTSAGVPADRKIGVLQGGLDLGLMPVISLRFCGYRAADALNGMRTAGLKAIRA